MKKNARILITIICIIIPITFLFLVTPRAKTSISKTSATLYINGECYEGVAIMYWYNRDELGTARFSIELIPVLEALGCKIKTGGTANGTKTVFQIGDREFTIYSSGELYDNKGLLCSDAAHPHNTIWRTGPLYFDDSNYKGGTIFTWI